jgi:segregation and condensation protein A
MLEEYQRYKEASKEMNGRFNKHKDAFYRGSPVFSSEEKYLDLDFYALMDAVKRAFDRAEPTHGVEADQFPIESRVEKIQKLLEGREWLLLDDVFATETKKRGVITCFMALLELVKQRKIIVAQDEAYQEVRIYPAPAAPAPAPEPGAEPAAEPAAETAAALSEPAPAAEQAPPADTGARN